MEGEFEFFDEDDIADAESEQHDICASVRVVVFVLAGVLRERARCRVF